MSHFHALSFILICSIGARITTRGRLVKVSGNLEKKKKKQLKNASTFSRKFPKLKPKKKKVRGGSGSFPFCIFCFVRWPSRRHESSCSANVRAICRPQRQPIDSEGKIRFLIRFLTRNTDKSERFEREVKHMFHDRTRRCNAGRAMASNRLRRCFRLTLWTLPADSVRSWARKFWA